MATETIKLTAYRTQKEYEVAITIGAEKPYGKPITIGAEYVGYLKGTTVYQAKRLASASEALTAYAKAHGYQFRGK